MLNEDTKRHTTLNIPHSYLIGNAAYLDKNQVRLLESKGVDYCFELTQEEGLMLGLIPEFAAINIPIELNITEKSSLFQVERQYKECIDFIYPIFEKKSSAMMFVLLKDKKLREKTVQSLSDIGLTCTESQLFGKILKYIKLVNKRKDILKSAENKLLVALELVKKHESQKGIIFVHNMDFADKVQKMIGKSSIVYHSKSKEQPLIDFRQGLYNQIIVIGKANVGYISADLEYSINISFEGKPLKSRQKAGRLLSVKEDKGKVFNYYLYIQDFEIFGVKINSQDKVWLRDNQKQSLFVEYKNLEDIRKEG